RRAVGLPGRAIVAGRIVRKPCETGTASVRPAEVVIAGVHRAVESNPGPIGRPGRTSHEPYALREPPRTTGPDHGRHGEVGHPSMRRGERDLRAIRVPS